MLLDFFLSSAVHSFRFIRNLTFPSCMLKPTTVLQDSLHFGLRFISFSSVRDIGFSSCIPISTATVHFPPQKSHFPASLSSNMMPLVCNARFRFSPANNSTATLLSTPSAHCTGGYSTTRQNVSFRRELKTLSEIKLIKHNYLKKKKSFLKLTIHYIQTYRR